MFMWCISVHSPGHADSCVKLYRPPERLQQRRPLRRVCRVRGRVRLERHPQPAIWAAGWEAALHAQTQTQTHTLTQTLLKSIPGPRAWGWSSCERVQTGCLTSQLQMSYSGGLDAARIQTVWHVHTDTWRMRHNAPPSPTLSYILALLGKDLMACGPLHTKELRGLCDVPPTMSVVTHTPKFWVSPIGQMAFYPLDVSSHRSAVYRFVCALSLCSLCSYSTTSSAEITLTSCAAQHMLCQM